VKDNGIVIDPKYQEKIVNLFLRLNSAEHREGVAIGLAPCKKISELHNGSIWVESEYGKGNIFFFTIVTDYF
jgi:light-regulated signal transduction histidine kinase (bacteriophytochrome)